MSLSSTSATTPGAPVSAPVSVTASTPATNGLREAMSRVPLGELEKRFFSLLPNFRATDNTFPGMVPEALRLFPNNLDLALLYWVITHRNYLTCNSVRLPATLPEFGSMSGDRLTTMKSIAANANVGCDLTTHQRLDMAKLFAQYVRVEHTHVIDNHVAWWSQVFAIDGMSAMTNCVTDLLMSRDPAALYIATAYLVAFREEIAEKCLQ